MLSQSQRNRLRLIHSYDWVEFPDGLPRDNLAAIYAEIESSEELWYASFIIQHDVEAGDLAIVLDHPLCDRGIATFIYWALDPCADNTPAVKQILSDLECRLLLGYYTTAIIGFSPDSLKRKRDDRIPPELFIPTPGIELPLDYSEAVFGPE